MISQAFPQRRVLVAEHDTSLRELLVLIFHLEHYSTDEAATLAEAHDKVHHNPYDLVLTDSFSPVPSQLEAIKRLQRSCFPTPVGILSGWRLDHQEVHRAGFAFALEKPFNLPHLLEQVSAHLHAELKFLHHEHAVCVSSYLGALNARRWEALSTLLASDVAYLPIRPSLFPVTESIAGKEMA